MKYIEFKHVSFKAGDLLIVNNVSLSIEQGNFVSLIGKTGSGKTTVLKLLSGLEKPLKGEIYIDNKTASKADKIIIPPHKRRIGFVFQDLALWPHLSVCDNISFGLKIKKVKEINERVEEIAVFMGIENQLSKFPSQLSGGQQQLTAIARSIILKPEILLLDEPMANLDVKIKATIKDRLKEINSRFKTTIIYVTHDHKEAFELSTHIIVFDGGVVLAEGTSNEIKASSNEFIKDFITI